MLPKELIVWGVKMRKLQYSILADIQDAIERAKQGKLALYWQRTIQREYSGKKVTLGEQQAYEQLQSVLSEVPQWSGEEDLRHNMENIGGRIWFCHFWILLVFMFDRIGRIADETPFVVEWFVRNGIPKEQIITRRYEREVVEHKNHLQTIQVERDKAQKDLISLKAEILACIKGESVFPKETLAEMITAQEEKLRELDALYESSYPGMEYPRG